MSVIPPPNEANDIFSLSDLALSERYQFVEEIGFGNWGSVWLCRPKGEDGRPIEDDAAAAVCGLGKVAVKLVHRSKTPTTAARVRSLWNEMKIVRSFKNDPHPSIIPFHNFIITPSYALISMAYLPTLIPVEVPEIRAKSWFLNLISAVAFLHARGVVHNDIKPANILLTAADPPVPVLVDFGFAEKYDPRSSKAFLSNLAYGTPEYLSPERARGLPHDTRKSDVWSLGVTLFEILRGRTPFEHAEPDGTTETFSTKADLEKYWARTVKGKWVGKWSMSRGLEKLLRKMILPNADLRITAPVALNDSYFDPSRPETPRTHQSRSSFSIRSPTSDAEASRLVEVAPPWADRSGAGTGFSPPASLLKTVAAAASRRTGAVTGKENAPPGANTNQQAGKENISSHARRESMVGHQRTQSAKGVPPASKLPALAQPLKHGARKAPSFNTDANGAVAPSAFSLTSASFISRRTANIASDTASNAGQINLNSSFISTASNRTSVLTASSYTSKENSVLSSRTTSGRRVPVRKPMPAIFAAAHKNKKAPDNSASIVYEDVSNEKEDKEKGKRRKSRVLVDLTKAKTNGVPQLELVTPVETSNGLLSPVLEADSPRLFPNDTFPRSPKESTGIGTLKQSIKQSLDKGIRLYKTSALGSYSNLLAKQSSGGLSVVAPECSRTRRPEQGSERASEDTKESWENESAVRNAKSSLPVVHHAIRNEQVAADNRLDRMTIWIRNVEKVVEDARASFAAGGMTPLPPLPPRVPPGTRRNTKASEIFRDHKGDTTNNSNGNETPASRPRRVTLLSRSPEATKEAVEESKDDSPAADQEAQKAQTQSTLNLARPITPLHTLQFDLDRKADQPLRSPTRSPTRLSAVLDPNAFFAPKPVVEDDVARESSYSPVERSRSRMTSPDAEYGSVISGAQAQVENEYVRILMASSGVKRLGKGYQSNITTSNIVEPPAASFKRNPKLFHSARRGLHPPPETPRKSVSVDELGALSNAQASAVSRREDGNNTIKLMRRAFKAITGGSSSRRLSKVL